MLVENEDILTIMPHRNSMLLLSKVVSYNMDEYSVEAEYHVTEDCIFYDPELQGVPVWVGFEFIAQAVCAFCGIRDKAMGVPPKKGLILALSQLKIGLPFFKTGSIITIKAKEVERMYPISVLEGELLLEGSKVLEGKMTIMEVDEANEKKFG